jgi:V/A-type H+-transporting ATPase subunit I
LQVFNLNDQAHMMQVSIGVGIAHVIIANLAAAWRQGLHTAAALAPLGWVTILLGATVIWIGGSSASTPVVGLDTAGFWVMGLGALAVLLFTRVQATVPGRLLQGLLALTRVLNVFGDVLSYLRLFALGLASASLAVAFNDLAAQLAAAGPGVGRLGAVLIVLFGHSLNLLLGIVSGFVHGLRLNFIEFFNWGIPEEGYPFRAFAKKETDPWSRSS